MISGNFRLQVIARVLLLGALLALLTYSLQRVHWYVTPVLLLCAALASVAELIWYVEKANKEFAGFLLAVKNSDFSRHSSADKRGKSFTDLCNALNIIVDAFQQARIDREADYILLQSIIQHITTSIMVYDDAGNILLINQAAEKLLHTPYLRNIHALEKGNPALLQYLLHLPDGNNRVLEAEIQGEPVKLLARATHFRRQGVVHTLVSVQNINVVIENSELEAWEQMLRVLTHEMMNSMTPISSLSGVLKAKMERVAAVKDEMDEEMIEDLSMGLKVIEQRSIGLVNFVQQYKSLITLPQPQLAPVSVKELLERVCLLKQEELKAAGIPILLSLRNHTAFIDADEGQIEQVLLNLINNAADACRNVPAPQIDITAWTTGDRCIIRIADNGTGIAPENLGRIFIPFYTTKKKGSGIGLSLSKQIMKMHQATIKISSVVEEGTVCVLDFGRGEEITWI